MSGSWVRAAAVAAAAGWLLTACPSVPQRPVEAQSWEVRRAELQARDAFLLAGRVAVAAGEEGFNARLRWTQSGEASDVALDGPLGAGGVLITARGNELRVANSRGEQLDADAARAEIERRLGFEPPLASLRYWVLGVPDPESPAEEVLDAESRLASLQQNGWRVDYDRYMAVDGRWLPQRLTLVRDGVRVKLLVERWQDS